MDNIKQFEEWKKIVENMDLTIAACPFYRGKLLTEDCEVEAYNKIQRLLNTPEFETAHAFLYSLDPTELTESENTKLNNLWKLGCERGYVSLDEPDFDAKAEIPAETTPPKVEPTAEPEQTAAQSDTAFTVLYSAMRNGKITTGEAYSNSVNIRAAKADVLAKLAKAGYQNVTILAIEAGDPDCCGMDTVNTTATDIPDYADDATTEIPTLEADEEAEDDSTEDDTGDTDDTADEENDETDDATDEENDEAADTSDEESGEEDAEADDEADKEDDAADDETDEEADKEDDEASDDTEDSEKKELTAQEKETLKNAYRKAFKQVLTKLKFAGPFNELNLEQKVKFFTELAKVWTKEDPVEFMTQKEVEQLEALKVDQPKK
jgi:hypothetical protein